MSKLNSRKEENTKQKIIFLQLLITDKTEDDVPMFVSLSKKIYISIKYR